MQLTGVSGVISVDPTTGNDNVYGGFYYGKINGVAANIVCDDANDTVGIPWTWQAAELNATQIAANLGSTLFGTSATAPPGAVIGVVGYAEVAGLVETMFAPGTTSAQQGELSTAIWAITSGKTSGLTGGAATYYDNAIGEYTGLSAGTAGTDATAALAGDGNLILYTPIDPTTGLPAHGYSQEYWTVPEGGAALLYLLLVGLACFGAMLFSSRNRFGKRETA